MASDNTDCKWQVTHQQVMTLMCNTHGAAPLLHSMDSMCKTMKRLPWFKINHMAWWQSFIDGLLLLVGWLIDRIPSSVQPINRLDTLKWPIIYSSQMDTLPMTWLPQRVTDFSSASFLLRTRVLECKQSRQYKLLINDRYAEIVIIQTSFSQWLSVNANSNNVRVM